MAESILGGKSLSVRDQEHLLRENSTLVARAKKAASNYKKQAEMVGESAASIAGGGLAGFIEGKYPTRAQAGGIPISVWAAAGLIGVAVTGYAGEYSNYVLAAGDGIGAYAAGMAAYKRGQKSAAAA